MLVSLLHVLFQPILQKKQDLDGNSRLGSTVLLDIGQHHFAEHVMLNSVNWQSWELVPFQQRFLGGEMHPGISHQIYREFDRWLPCLPQRATPAPTHSRLKKVPDAADLGPRRLHCRLPSSGIRTSYRASWYLSIRIFCIEDLPKAHRYRVSFMMDLCSRSPRKVLESLFFAPVLSVNFVGWSMASQREWEDFHALMGSEASILVSQRMISNP